MFFKRNCIGVEIEFTGVTREEVVTALENFFQVKAEAFKSSVSDAPYYAHRLYTESGKWLVLRDRSVKTAVYASRLDSESPDPFKIVPIEDTEYACEVVSPVLTAENFIIFLQVMSIIKGIGGIVNSSCGIHIHIDGLFHISEDGEEQEVDLCGIFNKYCEQEESAYEALNVTDYRRENYCKVFDAKGELDRLGIHTNQALLEWLYKKYSSTGQYGDRTLRYYGLNFHALIEHKTIEFRLFNGTLDIYEFVGYLKFALQIGYSSVVCEKYFLAVDEYFSEKGIDN